MPNPSSLRRVRRSFGKRERSIWIAGWCLLYVALTPCKAKTSALGAAVQALNPNFPSTKDLQQKRHKHHPRIHLERKGKDGNHDLRIPDPPGLAPVTMR